MQNSDFEKYLKSKKVNSSYVDYYKSKLNSMDSPYSMEGQVDVFSKLFNNRILMLTGEVDDYLCDLLKAQLLYLESKSNDDITIQINSGGGSVYSGLGLLDVMEYVKPNIITINTGLAASMASVILCSGTKGKRKALKRSRTMIHQPMSFGSYVQQASDIEIEAKEINSLKKELYEIISEKTGQNYDRVYKDGDRDYWMSASDALKYGMIDEIIQRKK
jgi:ATP-dependent Clp protease protease subunit